MKSYSELIKLKTFEDRFKYLRLDGSVGIETFGFDRYLNQAFYRSPEWKKVRDYVIIRDCGCDLAMPGYDILGPRKVIVHHMNPINEEDIELRREIIFDPEFLITTMHSTHNAIHYGKEYALEHYNLVARYTNDTAPWKVGL